MTGQHAAIVLQTLWRSGGTWLWAGFRKRPIYRAYCEPLHEALAASTAEDLERGFVGSTRQLRHPDLDANYFVEFPLQAVGGVALYPSRSPLAHFFQTADEADEETALYLERLVGYAAVRGQLPVFKFCRAATRAQWLRRMMPSAHGLYLNRNPDDLHRSYWSQGGPTNYFSVQYVALLLMHRRRSTLKPAVDWLLGPEDATQRAEPSLDAAAAMHAAWQICLRSDAQFSRNATLLIWAFSLADNLDAQNQIVDYDSLLEEPAALADLVGSLPVASSASPLLEAPRRTLQPEVEGHVVDQPFAYRVVEGLGEARLRRMIAAAPQLHVRSRAVVESLVDLAR